MKGLGTYFGTSVGFVISGGWWTVKERWTAETGVYVAVTASRCFLICLCNHITRMCSHNEPFMIQSLYAP